MLDGDFLSRLSDARLSFAQSLENSFYTGVRRLHFQADIHFVAPGMKIQAAGRRQPLPILPQTPEQIEVTHPGIPFAVMASVPPLHAREPRAHVRCNSPQDFDGM